MIKMLEEIVNQEITGGEIVAGSIGRAYTSLAEALACEEYSVSMHTIAKQKRATRYLLTMHYESAVVRVNLVIKDELGDLLPRPGKVGMSLSRHGQTIHHEKYGADSLVNLEQDIRDVLEVANAGII